MNYLLNTLAYNPPGERGGLPLLGRVGEPRRGARLHHPGRARPDPPRHRSSSTARSLVSARARSSRRRPQLEVLFELLNAPPSDEVCARAPPPQHAEAGQGGRGRLRLMQKQAPSVGRILVMVLFALSCFGLLLYLWLAFGGSIPLKPKGYRVKVPFPEATQLAQEADVRISGVPVGQVKTKELDPRTSAHHGRDRDRTRSTRRCPPTRARSCARRRCSARPTSSSRRARRTAAMLPEGGQLADAASVADGRARRDLPRVRPEDARGVPGLDATSRAGRSTAAARTSTTRSATSRRSPRTPTSCSRSSTAQERATQQLVRDTGEVFDALTERQGQLQQLIANANRVFETTAVARRGAGGDVPDPARPSSTSRGDR